MWREPKPTGAQWWKTIDSFNVSMQTASSSRALLSSGSSTLRRDKQLWTKDWYASSQSVSLWPGMTNMDVFKLSTPPCGLLSVMMWMLGNSLSWASQDFIRPRMYIMQPESKMNAKRDKVAADGRCLSFRASRKAAATAPGSTILMLRVLAEVGPLAEHTSKQKHLEQLQQAVACLATETPEPLHVSLSHRVQQRGVALEPERRQRLHPSRLLGPSTPRLPKPSRTRSASGLRSRKAGSTSSASALVAGKTARRVVSRPSLFNTDAMLHPFSTR